MKNDIDARLLSTASKAEVQAALEKRIGEYNKSDGPSGAQVLAEVQLFVTRLNTIEEEKVEARNHRLEWLVIFLIFIEVIFGGVELYLRNQERREDTKASEGLHREVESIRRLVEGGTKQK
jgi:hypothetical protein